MIRDYYKKTQCCFLRCRLDYDGKGTMLREIEKSELTYIVFNMKGSYCYCIVNNRFSPANFQSLMIDWCKRFNLGTAFVTYPYPERCKSNGQPRIDRPIVVRGYNYNNAGTVTCECDQTSVEKYIDAYDGLDPELYELHETHFPSNYSVYGRILGITNFKKLYPHLAA